MDFLTVIQCRFASSRLPGKAMAEISGRPLLEWVIDRTLLAKEPKHVVVATSSEPEDDIIEACAGSKGVPVIRGSRKDVLSRYLKALDSYPCEGVVRVTADNPLTDPSTMDYLIGRFREQKPDYSYSTLVPYGTGVDLFMAEKLKHVAKVSKEPRHREHINSYFLDHPDSFSISDVPPIDKIDRQNVRVSVDSAGDLERVRIIFSLLKDPLTAGISEITAAYQALPEELKRQA